MPVHNRPRFASRLVLLASLAGAALGLAELGLAALGLAEPAPALRPALGQPAGPLAAQDGSSYASPLRASIDQLTRWTWSTTRSQVALEGLLGDIVAAASGAVSYEPWGANESWDQAGLYLALSEASLRVGGPDRAVFALTARELARIAPTEEDRINAVRFELRAWEAVVVGMGAGSSSPSSGSSAASTSGSELTAHQQQLVASAQARILALLERGEHRADTSHVASGQFREHLEGRLDRLSVGSLLPRFLARDTAGNEIRSPLLLGQVLVVRFWEEGSPVSMAAHEEDALLMRKFWDAPVTLFGATSSGERDEHLELLEERAFAGTQIFDGPISTALADELAQAGHGLLHGAGLSSPIGITEAWFRPAPGSLVVVDERGVIRGRDLHGDDLERLVSLLVSERRAAIRAAGVVARTKGLPK